MFLLLIPTYSTRVLNKTYVFTSLENLCINLKLYINLALFVVTGTRSRIKLRSTKRVADWVIRAFYDILIKES